MRHANRRPVPSGVTRQFARRGPQGVCTPLAAQCAKEFWGCWAAVPQLLRNAHHKPAALQLIAATVRWGDGLGVGDVLLGQNAACG